MPGENSEEWSASFLPSEGRTSQQWATGAGGCWRSRTGKISMHWRPGRRTPALCLVRWPRSSQVVSCPLLQWEWWWWSWFRSSGHLFPGPQTTLACCMTVTEGKLPSLGSALTKNLNQILWDKEGHFHSLSPFWWISKDLIHTLEKHQLIKIMSMQILYNEELSAI